MRRSLAFLFAMPVFAGVVAAQTVHQVGPTGFATIQAAIDAAADGDVVRIAPGNYTAFLCRKSLRFVADAGGPVVVTGDARIEVRLTAGQYCEFVGIDFAGVPTHDSVLVAWGGRCTFEDCRMTLSAGLNLQDGTFVFRHCTVDAHWEAVYCVNGHLVASDCTFRSTVGGLMVPWLAAVRTSLAKVEMSRCTVLGASTAPSSIPQLFATTGLSLGTASGTAGWLVDCVVTGGSSANGGPGTPAVSGSVRTWRCTLIGGSGAGGPAPAVVGSEVVAPLLAGSSPAAPVGVGTAFAVDFTGAPADPIFLLAAFGLGEPVVVPVLEQPSYAFGALGGFTVGLQLAGPNGVASFPIAVPNVPALRNLTVWFRGIDGVRLPAQGSALLPVTIR